ncbi:unnamed protein product [Adineta steineri]|uniref:Uncharacterized protein n=1 Tax=Adineta steineri TaxID=433720 RepID=A0A814JQP4_9BILA|nr:unnamed protein product [Adineta steineri]CAF1042054.1 unnamed protein product [Adineta steineri]CAF1157425.1 unnamed protein product [Adineta steineri]CAF1220360.1 unnamed protein product [Adineta steineri]CAF1599178.1 unnamed protein product [Adineta steineri]
MADNNVLSDEQRKKFDESYKEKRSGLPVCPTCKSRDDVIPTVRGKPTHDLMLYAEEGNVKLSGCTQSYQGWCKKCETFI